MAPHYSRCNNDFAHSAYFSVHDGSMTPINRIFPMADPADGGKSRKSDSQFTYTGSRRHKIFPGFQNRTRSEVTNGVWVETIRG